MNDAAPIRFPWDTPPEKGEAREVAEGVFWVRLPLPMALDHVNAYVLDDGAGWCVVDTGLNTPEAVAIWEALLAGPFAGKPVTRVLLTHHHPDHSGLVGWFMARGARLETSRIAWLTARMLLLDVEERPTPQAEAFWRRAGMEPAILEERLAARPYNMSDAVAPIPVGYTRLREGDVIAAGGRAWDVRMGEGHAPEHVTLWSRDDALVIGGDQLLPSISPNIGVQPSEPDADPLGDWLESCRRLSAHARGDQLVLGGHKLPFTGLPERLRQMEGGHLSALDRLVRHLAEPRSAVECFPVLFRRRIDGGVYGLAMVEAVAHLNHLLATGRVTRTRREGAADLWQAVAG